MRLRTHPLPRLTLLAAAVLQALSPLAAPAQIVADPAAPRNQQPTVLRTPAGQPLVNIQTPSAAGVSRNTYRQFDVGPEGAVLNNSRTGAPTRIGGTVGANPWLARGEARVIVNEVNSNAPSLLRGTLEIAGRSAELIVANPVGIQVQGASFLNAQRVTLAVATPQWNGGDLLGLRTGNGLLRIDADPHGLGMDTRGASHTDILARAVQVNAAVWANRLRVVTGQNTVAPGTETEPGAVTPADPAAGPATYPPPAFALDVSALGGLYANAITLVGTEAGLGVRHSGIVAARAEDGAGSLVITQSGQLLVRQGGRLIGQRVEIQADTLVNEDGAAIAADRHMDIRVRRLTNRHGALIHSNADMALSATERLENRSATIEALGQLSITTGELLNANDLLTWRLLPNDPTNHLSYYTPAGEVDASQVAWSVPGRRLFAWTGREQLLLKGSPWADPVWRQRYLNPDPLVPGRWVKTGGTKSETWRWVPDAFTYSRNDPIWAAMGVTPPTWDPPAPRSAPDTSGFDTPSSLDASPEWLAQAAPWLALNERVQAMKQQVNNSLLGYDAYLSYRQNTYRAEVTASQPARIASGGRLQMRISGRATNQDSEILAGGTLNLQAGEVLNQATTVATPVQRSGTLYAWGVVGRDCNAIDCDPVYSWISSPYAVQTSRSQSLAALRQAGNLGTGTGTGAALYQPAPDPQSPFLLQSDPMLGADGLTSSQRQLDAMRWNTSREVRRLGDAAWEQQRLREQVSRLTGQRFLQGFQNDEAQYRTLLEAGVMAAQTLPLRPGVALSAEQVRQLTTDIVWLVEQTVSIPDGQGGMRTTTALVPQLYLAPRHQDLAPGGLLAGGAASGASQIGGQQVAITTTGDTTNSGSIQARGTLLLQSQNLRNLGGQLSADTVVALAQQDIENLGGQIAADSALLLQAGRDVRVASTTTEGSARSDGPGRQTRYALTEVDRQASVYVSGQNGIGTGLMLIQAGRDLGLQGAAVRNDGTGPGSTTQLTAARDLTLGTTTTGSQIDAQWQARRSRTGVQVDQTTEQGTSITTRGSLTLQAGQNLSLRGSELQSDADLRLGAGHTVLIDSAQSRYRIDYTSWHKSTRTLGSRQTTVNSTDQRITQHAAELTGANLNISGHHIVAVGAQLRADQTVALQATGQTLLLASQDVLTHERTRQTRSRSVGLPSRSESTEQALQTRSQATELKAGEQVRIGVGQRTELQGTRVQAPVIAIGRTSGAPTDTSGQLDLTLSIDTDAASQHSTSKTAGVWQSVQGSGFEQQTAQATVLQGELRIDPQLQVNAQRVLPSAELQTLQQQLQSQPGVRWSEVELAQRSWAYEQQGLTGLGAALVSLAVAWATGGMGLDMLGTTSAAGGTAAGSVTTQGGVTLGTTTAAGVTTLTAAGAAVNAAFTAVASMASVSLINNGGDIGKTLQDLGSAEAVKNLVASMATAGALQSLGSAWTIDGKPLAAINPQNSGFAANLGKNLVQGVGSAVITSTLTGANLQDALRTALVGAVVGTAAAFGANTIGDMVSGGQLNAAGQALLHALVGCAAGAAGQGGQAGCSAGAAGAVVGELAAAWYDPEGTKPAADTLAFVRAVSGVAGALAGGSAQSVNTGALTGVNAAQNNYLSHTERAQLAQAERACKTQGQQCDTANALRYKDALSDRLLANAVATCTEDGCHTVATFIRQEMARVGCASPYACTDQATLQGYWAVAQQKAQGLVAVYPESWLIDAKAALDLARLGVRLAASAGGRSSLEALQALGKTQGDDLLKSGSGFWRDGSLADPSRPLSPLGDWKPAALLSPSEADGMMAARLSGGTRVTLVERADQINAEVVERNPLFRPPYVPNSQIVTVQTTAPQSFVRVYTQVNGQSELAGSWMMRPQDIAGLTPEQIASKYALPQVPTHVVDVKVPAGQTLRASMANDVQIKQGIGGNGGGGGVQFEVTSPPKDSAEFRNWFTNPRPIR